MEKQFQSPLIDGLVGLLTGLGLFLLEASIRLVHLYFWTVEQAPGAYWWALSFYAYCGFLAGVGFALFKRASRTKGRVRWVGISLSVLFVVLLGVLRSLGISNTTGLSLKVVLRDLGLLLAWSGVFAAVAYLLFRLKRRFGIVRLMVAYGAGFALLVSFHIALLQSFSWEHVFAQLPKAERSGAGPNVLLLTIDTLRADRLGVYGYPKNLTPNMDLLAKEGTLFERAISQSPWTRPSFGSLLTSLYPSQHGAFVVQDPEKEGYDGNWGDMLYDGSLRDDVVTMPEIFRDRDYTTIALQTNWHVSAAHHFDQGFDSFVYESFFPTSLFERSFLAPSAKYIQALSGVTPRRLPFWMTAPPGSTVTEAFEALGAEGLPQPFFMWVHLMDPHSPYVVWEKGVPVERARITASYEVWDPDVSPSDLNDGYDSEVRYVDAHIGKIYKLLKAYGVLDNTIIILLSDHGEEFGDHQAEIHGRKTVVRGRFHGHSLYDELLRVPLIIRYPIRVPRGVRIKETVRLIDVLPTVLDLAGISMSPPENRWEGRSLLPLIMNGNDPGRPRFSYSERVLFGREQKTIQDGRYKLILQVENGDAELYDLKNDPKERTELAKREVKETDHLRKELNNWMQRMGSLLPSSPGASGEAPSDNERELLRSLGYIH